MSENLIAFDDISIVIDCGINQEVFTTFYFK